MRGISCIIEYLSAVIRISFIFVFALLLPRLFLLYIAKPPSFGVTTQTEFKLGLENITTDFLKSLTKRYDLSYSAALVTNQTGTDQQGNRNIDLLCKKGVHLKKIFTPEHGFLSGVQTLEMPNSTIDNIPIIPLYNKEGAKKLGVKELGDIEVIFFDVQDAGMRHYSYLITLLNILEVSAIYNKKIVILDRPNLLGPYMEGALVATQSQQDEVPIPVRYGMTVGELAQYFNKHVLKKPAVLYVVPMQNYDRHTQSRTLISQLSPNLSSIDSCYGYSFLGLLGEVAPFDIGVGTDRAFQCILLPESVKFSQEGWYELQSKLNAIGIHSKRYHYMSSRKKERCTGLQLSIRDIDSFSSFNALLTVLRFFKQAGVKLSFSERFDQAIGTPQVRNFIEGNIDQVSFENTINRELKMFFNKASSSFIYRPVPKLVMV